MTIFSDHIFSLTTFFEKTFQGKVFQNRSYVSKITPKSHLVLFVAKGAVANSGSDSSLLFLFRNGCGSAAIKFNKERERRYL